MAASSRWPFDLASQFSDVYGGMNLSVTGGTASIITDTTLTKVLGVNGTDWVEKTSGVSTVNAFPCAVTGRYYQYTDTAFRPLFIFANTALDGYLLGYLAGNSGTNQLTMMAADSSVGQIYARGSGGGDIPQNTWIDWAMVYNSNNTSSWDLYINNVNVITNKTGSGVVFPTISKMAVAGGLGVYGVFNGRMSDVRFWPNGLTSGQVAGLYSTSIKSRRSRSPLGTRTGTRQVD